MSDKKIAGVCSGIARYLNIDVTLVRVIFFVLALYPPGVGLLLYLACWIVMPRDAWVPPQAVAPSNGIVGTAG
jgi:phage shock protein C